MFKTLFLISVLAFEPSLAEAEPPPKVKPIVHCSCTPETFDVSIVEILDEYGFPKRCYLVTCEYRHMDACAKMFNEDYEKYGDIWNGSHRRFLQLGTPEHTDRPCREPHVRRFIR